MYSFYAGILVEAVVIEYSNVLIENVTVRSFELVNCLVGRSKCRELVDACERSTKYSFVRDYYDA